MSDHYFIYTVTGGHEVFYAVVERATGRVWTAPTKEVAHRQAREAGLTTFTERIIAKDALLESLGIHNDHRLRIDPKKPPRREPDPPPSSKTPWFVAGEGGAEGTGPQKVPQLPSMKGRKKAGRLGKGQNPFAASKPIGAPGPNSQGADDDMLIVPAKDHTSDPPTPFTDKPAAEPGELAP